jgi:hypothetical protein
MTVVSVIGSLGTLALSAAYSPLTCQMRTYRSRAFWLLNAAGALRLIAYAVESVNAHGMPEVKSSAARVVRTAR